VGIGEKRIDRTDEWRKFVVHAQKVQPPTKVIPNNNNIVAVVPSNSSISQDKFKASQFNTFAADISKDINDVGLNLLKLTELSKKKVVFSIEQQQIADQIIIIKTGIQDIKRKLDEFSRKVHNLKTSKQSETHSEAIISSLQLKLANTAKDFQQVLSSHNDNVKARHQTQTLLTGSHYAGVLSPSPTNFETSEDISSNFSETQALLQSQDRYLNARVEAVESIEQTIIELQEIFLQIRDLTIEHGDLTIRIDHQINETVGNVDAAQNQLLAYWRKMASNRWFYAKIFFVLLVFVVIFVVFFL